MKYLTETQICPLCDRKILQFFNTGGRDINMYECEVCGRVNITDQAISALKPEMKHILSAITREKTLSGAQPIDLSSGNIVGLTTQADVPRTISEKLDRIIADLSQRSEFPGQGFRFNPSKDYPLAYCKNENEFRYLLNQLKSQQLADFPVEWVAILTPKGWERADSFRLVSIRSHQAFIAMWFTPEMESTYSLGIEKAIKESGFRPLRVDKLEHNSKICDAIIAEIRRSAFLVADFTGHRGGVYFEAGFAMGLGIPVIWLCREDQIGDAHFDTRQYNHILWKDPSDLYEKLLNRVNATIVKRRGNGG